MNRSIQAIKGMKDILPTESDKWHYVEELLQRIAESYGYKEICFPILEQTDLFVRTIGEMTDVVEKEMYTFSDKSGNSVTMRPEGTASCVRAGIQNGLLYNQIQRLFYLGPMFRYERPQKGRLRQFHQFGIEVFGLQGPDIDAELLLLSARFWDELQIRDKVTLQLNTLGSKLARINHRKKLVEYFTANFELLDEDGKRRVQSNPLRILDSKNPELKELISKAPKILDFLDPESKQHFEDLQRLLDVAKVEYVINPCLVRGLDYYSLTVFEWVTNELGAQAAICAGGRYDGLVEEFGGKPTYAAGFALGLERLLDLTANSLHIKNLPHAYLIALDKKAAEFGLLLAEKLRRENNKLRLIMNCGNGNLSTQMKRADKSGAQLALIIGDAEMSADAISVKYLREDKPQEKLTLIDESLKKLLLQYTM